MLQDFISSGATEKSYIMASFAEIKGYFDEKFRALEEHSTKLISDWEENCKERDKNLMNKVNGFTEGLRKLARRQDILAEENENLRFELQRMKNEFQYTIGRERAPNLIIKNCATDKDIEETLRDQVLDIFEDMKIQIECEDIISAKREGRSEQNGSTVRPIKIRLSDPALKKIIFPVAKRIRMIHGVSIDNDYSPPQRKELFQVRETRRNLLQKGIECFSKGFNIVISNKEYNWQAALRYAQRSLSTQPRENDGNMSDYSISLSKRKADNISPLQPPTKPQHKPSKGRLLFRPGNLSQPSSPAGSFPMETSFAPLFDGL